PESARKNESRDDRAESRSHAQRSGPRAPPHGPPPFPDEITPRLRSTPDLRRPLAPPARRGDGACTRSCAPRAARNTPPPHTDRALPRGATNETDPRNRAPIHGTGRGSSRDTRSAGEPHWLDGHIPVTRQCP